MPRTKALTDRQAEDQAGLGLLAALQQVVMNPGEQLTTAMIADAVGLPRATMSRRIEDPMEFKGRELRQMAAIGVPREAMLAYLGYKPEKQNKPAADAGELADLLRQAIKTIIEEVEA